MFFQSKKKRLWRARVTTPTIPTITTTTTTTATTTVPSISQVTSQQQLLEQQTILQCTEENYHQANCHLCHLNQHQQQEQHYRYQHYHHHHQQHQHQGHHHQSQSQQQQQQKYHHPYSHTSIKQKCYSTTTEDGNYPSYLITSENEGNCCCCYSEDGIEGRLIDYDGDDQTMSSVTSTKITRSAATTTTITSNTSASSITTNWNCCTGGGSSNGENGQNNGNQMILSTTNNSNSNSSNNSNINKQKEVFRALVGKLKESQLTTLCQAIENTDGHHTDCVLVQRCLIMNEEPNLIACRLWRWPDIRNVSELKRIPTCPNEKDRIYICCNPTHWSRLYVPDTPPPPYQLFAMDRLKPEDRAPSENLVDGLRLFPGSLSTDDEDPSASAGWCQLAYWEESQRVGGRFPVENSSVNIFSDQPRGDGMCLKTLAEQRQTATPESVRKARQKIGLGVTLSQESDGVWLYNRSSAPVFVHSPTLNDIDYWFYVSKVPPGYCLRAFDSHRAKSQALVWPQQIAGAQTGPVDTFSMRISFAKGWGPNYTRQDVTACPCWLEVLFKRR